MAPPFRDFSWVCHRYKVKQPGRQSVRWVYNVIVEISFCLFQEQFVKFWEEL